MTVGKTVLFVVLSGLVLLGVVAGFVFYALPVADSATTAGIVGVAIGGMVGLFGSVVNMAVGMSRAARDADERLKDRISQHALELTRLEYQLRYNSLDRNKGTLLFLAPAKIYRTFYRALLELHTTGNWPKEVEELGLLSVVELAAKEGQ